MSAETRRSVLLGNTFRRRIPTTDGNVSLPVARSSPLGYCTHCNHTIMLAWNDDAGEVTIAHDYPVCDSWHARGPLLIGRRDVDVRDHLARTK